MMAIEDNISIREAGLSDIEQIAGLYRANYGEDSPDRRGLGIPYPWPSVFDSEVLVRWLAEGQNRSVVAVNSSGDIIGAVWLFQQRPHIFVVDLLLVHYEWPRHGLADRLLEHCRKILEQEVFFICQVECLTPGVGYLKLFLNHGFLPTGFSLGKYPPLFVTGVRESVFHLLLAGGELYEDLALASSIPDVSLTHACEELTHYLNSVRLICLPEGLSQSFLACAKQLLPFVAFTTSKKDLPGATKDTPIAPTRALCSFDESQDYLKVLVQKYDLVATDQIKELTETLEELKRSKYRHLSVQLPLAAQGCDKLVAALLKDDFILESFVPGAGTNPSLGMADSICLQWINPETESACTKEWFKDCRYALQDYKVDFLSLSKLFTGTMQ